ncbi:MAG: hypothetical protein ACKO6N_17270 [Myxococcota bacterium]
MRSQTFESEDQFIEALQAAAVRGVVVRETCERRPVFGPGHQVSVEKVHRGELLAYRAGEVWRCWVQGERLPSLCTHLTSLGMTLRRVSSNIT